MNRAFNWWMFRRTVDFPGRAGRRDVPAGLWNAFRVLFGECPAAEAELWNDVHQPER